jgi:hypothetical protein
MFQHTTSDMFVLHSDPPVSALLHQSSGTLCHPTYIQHPPYTPFVATSTHTFSSRPLAAHICASDSAFADYGELQIVLTYLLNSNIIILYYRNRGKENLLLKTHNILYD